MDSSLAFFAESHRSPITLKERMPRAWRVDTDLAQLYEVPQLLSNDECSQLIALIDAKLEDSKVQSGRAEYRTSKTCFLARQSNPLVEQIDLRLASYSSRRAKGRADIACRLGGTIS